MVLWLLANFATSRVCVSCHCHSSTIIIRQSGFHSLGHCFCCATQLLMQFPLPSCSTPGCAFASHWPQLCRCPSSHSQDFCFHFLTCLLQKKIAFLEFFCPLLLCHCQSCWWKVGALPDLGLLSLFLPQWSIGPLFLGTLLCSCNQNTC